MKTIIAYASKYGTTTQVAQKLASGIENSLLLDLSCDKKVKLEDIDFLVIGTPIYAGSIHKAVKRFLNNNVTALAEKNFAFFICGLDTAYSDDLLNRNFTKEIVQAAITITHVGGLFDPNKATFLEKMIMKLISKSAQLYSTLDEEKIADLIKLINAYK